MLTVDIELHHLERQWLMFAKASQSQIMTASRRAINQYSRQLRTQVTRSIAGETKIKSSLIRKALTLLPARARHLQSVLGLKSASGKIQAMRLGTAKQTRRGVSVGSHRFDQSFIADMPSGHRGVYKRVGRSRLPISEQYRYFTRELIDAFEVIESNEARFRLQTLFERELRFITK